MSGTTESLKLMVQLLTSEQVTGLDADMWMTSLAFVQNPTIDMLADVKVSFFNEISVLNSYFF